MRTLTSDAEVISVGEVFCTTTRPLLLNISHHLISICIYDVEICITATNTSNTWALYVKNLVVVIVKYSHSWFTAIPLRFNTSNGGAHWCFDSYFRIASIAATTASASSTTHKWTFYSDNFLLSVVCNMHREPSAWTATHSPV